MGTIRILRNKLKVSPLGVALARYYRHHKGRSKNEAYKLMETFGHGDWSEEKKEKCYRDMVQCSKRYHFKFNEYFQFHLYEKSEEERKLFVSDNDRVWICEEFNNPANQHIFDSKAETARHFKKWFRRDYCYFESKKDSDDLYSFLSKHGDFIVKPIEGAGGHGIQVLHCNKSEISAMVDYLINEYCAGVLGGGIAEELIDQDDRMKSYHVQSVNTVRIPTLRLDDRVVLFHPILRIGLGDSVVDNTGAGGIICALDADTGTVIAACDRKGHTYTRNPNNGKELIGSTIPEWDKVVALAKELASVVPDNRYTGWDLALAKDGWMLVEANARAQWGSQIALQKGYRNEINIYRSELGMRSI